MNLDDLKNAWQERHDRLADCRFDELAARAQSRVASFERAIMRRDVLETAAAILVSLVFGYFLRTNAFPPVARLGMAIMILGAAEVVVVLHWTRRRGGRPRLDLPFSEYCAAELARVERQIRLLRNINWWYTGPLLLGVCVFVGGILFSIPELPLRISLPALGVFSVLVLIFGWGIYQINQQAVDRELAPLRDELVTIQQAFVDEPPTTGDAADTSP